MSTALRGKTNVIASIVNCENAIAGQNLGEGLGQNTLKKTKALKPGKHARMIAEEPRRQLHEVRDMKDDLHGHILAVVKPEVTKS